MTIYSQGSQYTPAKHRMKIVLWIARCNRPFSIIEDPELLDIFHDLNAACTTVSCKTVSRDVKKVFLLAREQVGAMLRVSGLLTYFYVVKPTSLGISRQGTHRCRWLVCSSGHLVHWGHRSLDYQWQDDVGDP